MQISSPVHHVTHFEHFTYVVYITTDEQNVHKTNAHVPNENIRQFAKPFPSCVQNTQHNRENFTSSPNPFRRAYMYAANKNIRQLAYVCKPIIVKAYQYIWQFNGDLSISKFLIFMLDRVGYGD